MSRMFGRIAGGRKPYTQRMALEEASDMIFS